MTGVVMPSLSHWSRGMLSPTLRFRAARAVRRLFNLDRERRWNTQYATGVWDRLRALDELAHHAMIAGYVRMLKPGGSVLDVACGEGLLRDALGDACHTYLGIDFTEPIRLAEPRVTASTRFAVADMHEFTTHERFDAIIFNESLYYFEDPLAGLTRYVSLLASNGVLLVSMHETTRTTGIWDRLADRFALVDEVRITNRRDVSWTVKALAPLRP